MHIQLDPGATVVLGLHDSEHEVIKIDFDNKAHPKAFVITALLAGSALGKEGEIYREEFGPSDDFDKKAEFIEKVKAEQPHPDAWVPPVLEKKQRFGAYIRIGFLEARQIIDLLVAGRLAKHGQSVGGGALVLPFPEDMPLDECRSAVLKLNNMYSVSASVVDFDTLDLL